MVCHFLGTILCASMPARGIKLLLDQKFNKNQDCVAYVQPGE